MTATPWLVETISDGQRPGFRQFWPGDKEIHVGIMYCCRLSDPKAIGYEWIVTLWPGKSRKEKVVGMYSAAASKRSHSSLTKGQQAPDGGTAE